MGDQRTLWLADHLLKDGRGHHANYNRALAEAARRAGWDPVIACHRDVLANLLGDVRCAGIFRDDLRASPPRWAANSQFRLSLFDRISRARFKRDLQRGMRAAHEDDVIFAQMLAPRHLRAWLEWHNARAHPPHLVLHLGYDPTRFAAYLGLLDAAAAGAKKRYFVTDSERLAPIYGDILRASVGVLPHVVPESIPMPSGRVRTGSPRVLSLGNPRREKGFVELADAALKSEGIDFAFQVNDPDDACKESVEKLRRAGRFELAGERLSESEYCALLASADAVAIPYHLDIYRDRTSGIVCEALVAGKPVITTRGSWMSGQIDGCGWLAEERDPDDLRRVLARVPDELPAVSARAREMAGGFRARFSGKNFIASLDKMICHA